MFWQYLGSSAKTLNQMRFKTLIFPQAKIHSKIFDTNYLVPFLHQHGNGNECSHEISSGYMRAALVIHLVLRDKVEVRNMTKVVDRNTKSRYWTQTTKGALAIYNLHNSNNHLLTWSYHIFIKLPQICRHFASTCQANNLREAKPSDLKLEGFYKVNPPVIIVGAPYHFVYFGVTHIAPMAHWFI